MFSPRFYIVLFTTILSFASLYIPQPILPELGRIFDVTPSEAALLVSITMFPMAFAPIFYGYFLQSVSAKRLLLISLIGISSCQFIFALAPSYEVALLSRGLLGLALPATFTALMTLTTEGITQNRVRTAMGVYIATTIIGGFLGRVTGGTLTTLWHWKAPFLIIGTLLIMNLLLISRMQTQGRSKFAKPRFSMIIEILRTPHYIFSYLVIFCVFFVFSGILNNLAFRLEEIDPQISAARISATYAGYLIGICIALGSSKLVGVFGSELTSLYVGILALLVSVVLFGVKSTDVVVANIFMLSIGMFFSHSVLTALVNHHATYEKPMVNGLYLSIYYAGGGLGALIPTLVYVESGWINMLILLSLFCLLAGIFVRKIFQRTE